MRKGSDASLSQEGKTAVIAPTISEMMRYFYLLVVNRSIFSQLLYKVSKYLLLNFRVTVSYKHYFYISNYKTWSLFAVDFLAFLK